MKTKIFCTKYISDYIDENEVYYWTNYHNIFISSSTGTGKNYFINNVLVPIIIRQNKKILILNNRVALCYQEKMELINKIIEITGDSRILDEFNKYNHNNTSHIIHLNKNIDICSYQYLAEHNFLSYSKYLFVILDECHFFLSDSGFNPYTDEILSIVLSTRGTTNIFISATLNDLFQVVTCKDKSIMDPNLNSSILYYNGYINKNIESINPVNSITSLSSMINKGDKWVIFVNNKNTGKSLHYQLTNKGIDSVFISREEIDTNESSRDKYNLLIHNQSTNNITDVLISTSVLDNGINLRFDEDVNVFIDSLDKTQFLQMLGRIRGKIKIRLFYRNCSKEEIKEFISRTIETIYILIYNTSLKGYNKEIEFDNKYNYIKEGKILVNLLSIIYMIYKVNELLDFYNLDISSINIKLHSEIISKCKYIYHSTDILFPYSGLIESFFNGNLINPIFGILSEQSIRDIRDRSRWLITRFRLHPCITDDLFVSLSSVYSELAKKGINLSFAVDDVYKNLIIPKNYINVIDIQKYWVINRLL